MILYADASSLIKLYVQEEGSEDVARLVDEAESLTTSGIAYVEVHAGMARALRARRVDNGTHRAALDDFERRWQTLGVVELPGRILYEAASLAQRHVLKSLDAIHLASAMAAERTSGERIVFTAFDADLLTAARAEGLAIA